MSEADDGRDWQLYVEDMLDFAQQVASYTHGMDQRSFIADRRTYDATLRNIELIGDAAAHIPAQARRAYPGIEWQRIVATRDRAPGSGWSKSSKRTVGVSCRSGAWRGGTGRTPAHRQPHPSGRGPVLGTPLVRMSSAKASGSDGLM